MDSQSNDKTKGVFNFFRESEDFFLTLLFLVFFIGVLLRIAWYFYNRSIWGDEAAVIRAILTRPMSGLFSPIFNFTGGVVATPVGLLLAVKTATIVGGQNEYALRFVQFFCGILLLFFSYVLSKKILEGRIGRIMALAGVVMSGWLINYCLEVKPYSCDALAAVLLVLLALYLGNRPIGRSGFFVLVLAGILVPWFSFSSVIILFVCGSYLIYCAAAIKDYRKVKLIGLAVLIWLVYLSVYVFFFLQPYLASYWLHEQFAGSGFSSQPLFSVPTLFWAKQALERFLINPLRLIWPVQVFVLLVGAMSLLKRSFRLSILILGPGLVSFVFGLFGLYPFSERLLVFLIPFAMIVLGEGVEFLIVRLRSLGPLPGFILIFLILAPWGKLAPMPLGRYESRPAVMYVIQNARPGDGFFSVARAVDTVWFYSRGRGIDFKTVSCYDPQKDIRKYLADLDKLKSYPRAWIIISHIDQDKGFEESLIKNKFGAGLKEDRYYYGSRVYLLDNVNVPAAI
jgi:hypothetical protein